MIEDAARTRCRILSGGERVLVGLTVAETSEFDDLANPRPVKDDAMARAEDERWMALYLKHEEAWQKLCKSREASRSKPKQFHMAMLKAGVYS